MGEIIQKPPFVKEGDPLSAGQWNDVVRLARGETITDASEIDSSGTRRRRIPTITNGQIEIVNRTSADLPAFAVLGVGDSVCKSDEPGYSFFERSIAFDGYAPSSSYLGKFAVLQERCTKDQPARAVIQGPTIVRLYVTTETSAFDYADVDGSLGVDGLALVESGAARVLWRETGSGFVWGIVLLQATPTGGPGPTPTEYDLGREALVLEDIEIDSTGQVQIYHVVDGIMTALDPPFDALNWISGRKLKAGEKCAVIHEAWESRWTIIPKCTCSNSGPVYYGLVPANKTFAEVAADPTGYQFVEGVLYGPAPPPPVVPPTTPTLWLDASGLDAGAITAWPDTSGNSNDASGTATVIAASIGGKNAVQFNGTSDLMIGGACPTTGDDYTMIAVLRFNSPPDTGIEKLAVHIGNNASSNGAGVALHDGNYRSVCHDYVDWITDDYGTTSAELWTAVRKAGTLRLWINGAEQALSNPTADLHTPTDKYSLGAFDTAFWPADVDIGEVQVYDGAVTDEKRAEVEAVLMAKWFPS